MDMADRLTQYPMMPQSFPNTQQMQGMLPQQSQQQSQGDPPHPLRGVADPERARMWAAMEQAQNQSRNQNGGAQAGTTQQVSCRTLKNFDSLPLLHTRAMTP